MTKTIYGACVRAEYYASREMECELDTVDDVGVCMLCVENVR